MAIFVCLHGDKLRWHLSQKLALMSVSKVYHQKRNDKGDHLTGKVGSLVASRVVDGDASQWQVRSLTQLYSVGSISDQCKNNCFINTQSRFVSDVFNGVLGPMRLAHHT